MVDFIESGFWQALLFTIIIGAIGGIIGFILKKKVPVLAAIFQCIPSIFAFFYVWHIRHGIGWLIFAIIGVIGFVATLIGAIIGSKKVSSKIAGVVKLDTDEELKNFAEQSNINFPKMVNDTTRIESIDTNPGKIIIFNVTLLNLNNEDERIPSIKSNVYKNMLTNMKYGTDAETVIYRNNNISCRYVYNDVNGNLLFDVEITPNDYL